MATSKINVTMLAAGPQGATGATGVGATDATSSSKGIVQLAGDLSGTAGSPTVLSRTVTKTVAPTGTAADYNTDGTADDVEIQAALDAINSAGGGTLNLRKGTYSISTSITFYSNIIIEGEGGNATILKMANGANLASIFSGNSRTNVIFRDFQLDGNKANQTLPNIATLISSSLSSYLTFVNLYVHDSVRQGIYLGGAYACTWMNCRSINNGKDIGVGSPTLQGFGFGINDSGGVIPSKNRFIGCYASGNAEGGFSIFGSDSVHRPVGNVVVGSTVDNDSIGVNLWLAKGNTITGCTFSNLSANALGNGGSGLSLHGAIGNAITGNTIDTTTTYGVFLNNSATDNIFTGNTVINAGNHGINADTSPSNIFTANTCEYNSGSGIRILSGDNNGVSNNRCSRNNADGITIQHAGAATVVGNTCNNNSQLTIGSGYGIQLKSLSGGGSGGSSRNIVSGNYATDAQAAISSNLAGSASSGQPIVTVADTSIYWVNQKVTLTESSTTENVVILSIDTATQLTMTSNLVNSYTTSATLKGRTSQRYGIFEETVNCDNNQIIGNVCRTNANGQIVTAGANTQVAHNLTS